MASSLSTIGKNVALDAVAGAYGFAAAYTGDPGATGVNNEVTGGSPVYTRQPITWDPANGGSVVLVATFPVFDVPPGTTISYIGIWTLAGAGTYGGCWDVADEVFNAQGTYTLTAGSIAL